MCVISNMIRQPTFLTDAELERVTRWPINQAHLDEKPPLAEVGLKRSVSVAFPRLRTLGATKPPRDRRHWA